MSFRSRYLVYVSGWAAVVAALVVGVPAVLRSRLPEHVAVDWDFTDHPQDSADLRDFVASRLLCWLVVAAFWGWFGLRARTERRWVWTAVLLAATGVVVAGEVVITVLANLDATDFRQARSLDGQGWVLVCCAVAAFVTWRRAGRRWTELSVPRR